MHARYRISMVIKQYLGLSLVRSLSKRISKSEQTQIFFFGLIISSFLSTANRKLDVRHLDLVIAGGFFLIFLLGSFLLAQEFFQGMGSTLTRITLSLGLLTSLLFALGLGLIRLTSKFRDVTWNVDSKLFLSQAYSYISHGNSISSNSYSGFDIQYHAVPSYISAQVFKYLEINPGITLFLAVPLVSITAIYFFAKLILIESGLSKTNASLGALVVLSIPYVTSISQREKFLTPLINSELMLNSQLAIAVVAATSALYLKNVRGKYLLTALGFISLWSLKPQYIPFAILSLSILAIIRLPDRKLNKIFRKTYPIILTSAFTITFLYIFSKSELNPEYTINFVRLSSADFLRKNLVVFLILPILFVLQRFQKKPLAHRKIVDLYLVVGVFLICSFLLEIIAFEPSPTTLRKMQVFQPTGPAGDSDFNQGLILLFVLIAIMVTILTSEIELSSSIIRRNICTLLISLFILRILAAVPLMLEPSVNGYEVTNLATLRQVLNQAERRVNMPKILVNDFADPAEGYRRNGSGMYWSSIGIGEFYLSDINTFHFLAPDIENRLKNTKIFFNTPISDFHLKFIESKGIDFIIINKRCTPIWYPGIRQIFANSEFAIIDAKTITRQEFNENGISSTQILHYGVAPCI